MGYRKSETRTRPGTSSWELVNSRQPGRVVTTGSTGCAPHQVAGTCPAGRTRPGAPRPGRLHTTRDPAAPATAAAASAAAPEWCLTSFHQGLRMRSAGYRDLRRHWDGLAGGRALHDVPVWVHRLGLGFVRDVPGGGVERGHHVAAVAGRALPRPQGGRVADDVRDVVIGDQKGVEGARAGVGDLVHVPHRAAREVRPGGHRLLFLLDARWPDNQLRLD